MPVFVVAAPAYAAVSLPEAKAHLRVDYDTDDEFIESLIEVATNTIDGPTGWLGRALITQTLEFRSKAFSHCDVRLPYPPIIDILSVKYDDANGSEQIVDPSFYRLVGSASAPRLALSYGSSWPYSRYQENAVRIRYRAGYGETVDDIPGAIKHAILIMVAELYQNRELTAEQQRQELPFAASALLSTYRVFA